METLSGAQGAPGELLHLQVPEEQDLETAAPAGAPKGWQGRWRLWTGRVTLGLFAVAAALTLRSHLQARRARQAASSAIAMFDRKTFRGIALKSGDANYDTVFNQTVFDCVQNAKKGKEGACFDAIYGHDAACRELTKDPVRGTCTGFQSCLTGQPWGPINNPCDASCGDMGHEHMLESCHLQFSALRLLSRTCVPKWVIHDQKTDWRLYQVRDMINGITKRCGHPIKDDPFFNS